MCFVLLILFKRKVEGYHRQIVVTSSVCSWKTSCSGNVNSYSEKKTGEQTDIWTQSKRIDYILVRKRFRSGLNIARIRSFPGADIESDHDLLIMTFRLRLKKKKKFSKPKHTRLKFDLEKLKDPNVLETFQAMIGGRFAPLTIMSNEDTDIDSMITIFNTAVTETTAQYGRDP